MKTNQEIHSEARHLMVLGAQFQSEQRAAGADASSITVPRVLMNFPATVAGATRTRHIDAAVDGGALVYRLMQREAEAPSPDQTERSDDPFIVFSSASAHEVLRTGYEIAEEERLTAELERSADRADLGDRETAVEVEAILETDLLPAAEQLRTKFEVREFIEGRLEASVLSARAIERRASHERPRHDLAERHELKLTVGQP